MLLYRFEWYGNEKWKGHQFGLHKYTAYFIHSSLVSNHFILVMVVDPKPIP